MTWAGFEAYLRSLVGSWRALAAPHHDAAVIETPAYVAARFASHPLLDNALLFDPDALGEVRAIYADAPDCVVWSASDPVAAALVAAGFRRQEVTVAMRTTLSRVAAGPVAEVGEVDPSVVADLNDVPDDLVADVPGVRGYATADRTSGALLIGVGDDVNVSFVATRRHRRRRGLASAVLAYALADAADHGARTASLQATAMAAGLYRRLGFRQVGLWQEWVPD